MINEKVIRATYDSQTITVYQAYNDSIALPAVQFQKFTPPFKKERMTWIKPSFLWMMYRSAWATKKNQEHVLAIKLKREGFEWALENSCFSYYDNSIDQSYESWKNQLLNTPVRIQWDPERDLQLQRLSNRSIQIGLSGVAVDLYNEEWIVNIKDITTLCKSAHCLIEEEKINQAINLLPRESIYPLPEHIAFKIYRLQ